jgi:hypothetical protein
MFRTIIFFTFLLFVSQQNTSFNDTFDITTTDLAKNKEYLKAIRELQEDLSMTKKLPLTKVLKVLETKT